MQDDLQLIVHIPHDVHFSWSIRILNREKRENNPRNVPTGHTELQYRRPLKKASNATTVSTAAENEKAYMSNEANPTLYNACEPNSPVTYARALFAATYTGEAMLAAIRPKLEYGSSNITARNSPDMKNAAVKMASTEYLSTLCGREYA